MVVVIGCLVAFLNTFNKNERLKFNVDSVNELSKIC